MDYRVFTPHKLLAPYVRYFSVLNFNKLSGLSQIKVFADRYPHLVFQHNNGRSAFFRDTDALPPAFISGVKISPYILDLDNHEVVTVTFYPQAIKQLFGINVNELNDQIVDLINFAPADLLERLFYSRCLAERIDLLTEFLLKKINDAAPPDHLISESIRLINDIDIETSLNSLSNYFKISTRQFERRFKSSTGLSPKLFIRAARFESALQAIRDNQFENLSGLAHYLNFADQSHFIKEFKTFSGLTPKTFLFNNQKTQSVIPDNGVVTINHLVTEC